MLDARECFPLRELVELCSDKVAGRKDASLPYIGLEQMAEGVPELLGVLPSSASVSVNSVFRRGDVLFGKLRPNLRKSLQAAFDGYCSTDILVLRPRPDYHPEFVAKVFQWQAVFDAAVRTAEGTKMPRTSWDKLKEFHLPVPGLPEQRRIADILDATDAAIRQTEALIAKLRQMKAGLLHDLLTRGLDERGRLRHNNPVLLNEHFEDRALGELFSPRREPGYPGLPVVAVTMHDGLLPRDPKERRVETNLSPEQHLLARKDDIAYNMMRMWQGACGLALEDCILSPAYVVLEPHGIVPAFAYRLFKSPEVIQLFHNRSRGLTADRWRLYPHDFAAIVVRVPRSLDEQRRIAEMLDAHDARIHTEEAYRDKLKLQKHGLMHDLLTGRVRV